MKLYTYDESKLRFIEVRYVRNVVRLVSVVLVCTLLLGGKTPPPERIYVNTTEDVLIVKHQQEFSEELLILKIKELNLPYPHITLAQAKLETGNYSSNIFKENNNLFGMKEARVRINLAKGTQFGHAYYDHWEESILDYAFWYSSYARKCKSEKELYQLLDSQYAEANNYVKSLKRIVKRENLEEKFNS